MALWKSDQLKNRLFPKDGAGIYYESLHLLVWWRMPGDGSSRVIGIQRGEAVFLSSCNVGGGQQKSFETRKPVYGWLAHSREGSAGDQSRKMG